MNRKLTLTGANVLFLIFTVVFLAYQLIIGVIMGEAIYDYMYPIIIVNELMIAGSVLIYCLVRKINIKQTFRFNNPGLTPCLIIAAAALPATLAAGMFNSLIIYALQFIGDLPAQAIPVPTNLSELLIGILIVGVAPGVCEEFMHRGFLLRAYEKRGSYKAVVIVAIYFGLFHFDVTNLLGPIFLGLIIGYYTVRTNSIYAGILAHFLNNAISELVQYFSGTPQPEKLTISDPEMISTLVLGIICLIITAALLYVFKMVTEKRAVIIPSISRAGQDIKTVLSHWPIIIIIVLYILMMLLYILSVVLMKQFGL